MNIFLLSQVPSGTIDSRDSFDAIVFGTSAYATMDAAKKAASNAVEEFSEEPLTWTYDAQLAVWKALDESEELWVISEVQLG